MNSSPESQRQKNTTEGSADGTCSTDENGVQHYVVGIGASAGGLEALEKLFESIPEKSGLSYVVVQHLSPDFESHMDELLRRVTQMNVSVAENETTVEPDQVYLIPPKAEMVISNGKLLLTERASGRGLNHPIDIFFRSLANDCQRYAVGIVLSGTGSDGSRGVVDITDVGGMVIAQDADTCKFDAMPLNALETGAVHLVLPPEAVGEALCKYVTEGVSPDVLRDQQLGEMEETGLKRVFQLLRQGQEIDFSFYKLGTVERRIRRRMELLKISELDDYIQRLSEDGVEVNDLYRDLLIGVTRFFRDAEAFDHLRQNILPDIIRKAGQEEVRIWVCGCATGEEAYSVCILFLETYRELKIEPNFKMFATDAHKESLQFAAAGIYPEASLKQMSEQRQQDFFLRRQDGYAVTAEVRSHVVFAPHNLIADPPFTQMHLVTCRNLLIYLQPTAQRKALSLFHFALKRDAVLFMGPSESPGELRDEFEVLQKSWKIFRKRRDVRLPVDLKLPSMQKAESRRSNRLPSGESESHSREILPTLYDAILGDLMPPSILIDAQFQLLHAFPGTEAILRFVPGRPTTNVLELVYPSVKTSLAAAAQHCLRDETLVRYTGVPHPSRADLQLELIIRPYKAPRSSQTYLLVQFDSVEGSQQQAVATEHKNVDLGEVASSRIESLEQDLSFTQQNLQATIEELETSNEELQATNEEMVAANEELQSTNEELHSVNEELYTINAEHQTRVKQLDEANADMNNLLATTHVGVVFLDREFHIRRFTPVVGQMLYMEPQDIGRSFEGFAPKLEDPRFMQRLDEVLDTRTEQEWEICCNDNYYLVRAMPYWTGSEVAGVVVSFVSIDSIKRTEAELTRFKFMADHNVDAQVLFDRHSNVVYANEKMGEELGYSSQELRSKDFSDFDCEHDFEKFQERFEKARESGGLIFESTHVRRDGTRFPVEVAVTFVEFDGIDYLFSTIRNVTTRRKADKRRRMLERAIEAVGSGIVISDPQLNDNPLTFVNSGFCRMTGYSAEEVLGKNCRMLQGEDTDPAAVVKIRDGIRTGESTRVLIQNYRKDGTPFWNDVFTTPVRDSSDKVIAFVGVQNDVTDRVAASRKLQERERTIRLLLNSTAEGIFGLDIEGRCTFINSSALKMLGHESSDAVVGRLMHQLVLNTTDAAPAADSVLAQSYEALREGIPFSSTEEVFVDAQSSAFPVEMWSHPLFEEDVCRGAVVTFVDTSNRRKELAELREARESADAANAAKSRFLANMSHELRTPLAAILGFTEILQEQAHESDTQEKLETIHRNGHYLLRLLNDVLDLSRIEAGKFETTFSPVGLSNLLAELNETMQMRTRDNNSTLEFHLKNPLPVTVTTDGARVRQVLINLIGNAIKFAPDGHIDVHVSCEESDNDICWLKLIVKDDGIGMSQAQVNDLFQPFSQADATIAKRFGGSGLGLSISHRLSEILGGKIQVASKLGEGSSFTFRCPVSPIGKKAELSLIVTRPGDSGDSGGVASGTDPLVDARVLIVDDMRDVRFIASHLLSKAGCNIVLAGDGQEAISKIEESIQNGDEFDLVLMDVQMPVMNGEEALIALRSKGISVPVIALTADAMKGARRRLIGIGFDEYLTKPLDRTTLLDLARLLLLRRE